MLLLDKLVNLCLGILWGARTMISCRGHLSRVSLAATGGRDSRTARLIINRAVYCLFAVRHAAVRKAFHSVF